jgi:hypothetical protein
MNLLCLLGIHDWQITMIGRYNRKRTCRRCGAFQYGDIFSQRWLG